MNEIFTIIGADGFIGRALAHTLKASSHQVLPWTRRNRPEPGVALGHVFFTAGITADFRNRPLATAETHVGLLAEILKQEHFKSLTYLSSARLYRLAKHTHEEAEFAVNPADPEQLYDLTKLAGESLCLNDARDCIRVVRLSNVAGVDARSPNFLSVILRSGLMQGHIALQSSPQSAKDYVVLEDVVTLLPRIALGGKKRLYNLASGQVTEAGAIAERIAALTGCSIASEPGAPLILQPAIDITRITDEFGFAATPLMAVLEDIVHDTRIAIKGQDND